MDKIKEYMSEEIKKKTNSMEQSPSWEANTFSASQEVPYILRNPKVHHRTNTYFEPDHSSPCLPFHFLKIHFNIILSSTPRSSKWYTASWHSTCQISCPSSYACVVPKERSKSDVELVVSTSTNLQAGRPHVVGCPRLLIQCIRSYFPYWRPFLHPQPEDAPRRGDRDPLVTTAGKK
jgi:hypothetical protein